MGEWGEVPGLRVKIISLNSLCTVLICTVWRSKPAEALFEWHYIWEYPTAARILGGYSSWGKKPPRVEITVSKLRMHATLSQVRTENEFYRWCWKHLRYVSDQIGDE